MAKPADAFGILRNLRVWNPTRKQNAKDWHRTADLVAPVSPKLAARCREIAYAYEELAALVTDMLRHDQWPDDNPPDTERTPTLVHWP